MYLLFIFLLDSNYELKTTTACSTNGGGKVISGYHKDVVESKEECEAECGKYDWCKGYRIEIDDSCSHCDPESCRLLTDKNDVDMGEGWDFLNEGNWVEPDQWQESFYTGYECYVKPAGGKHLYSRPNID